MINIVSASFGDDQLEVTYTEPDETVPSACLVRLVMVKNRLVQENLDEVVDLLRGIVDEALVAIRTERTLPND